MIKINNTLLIYQYPTHFPITIEYIKYNDLFY